MGKESARNILYQSGARSLKTTTELVYLLGQSMTHLNSDVCRANSMIGIEPGERGVMDFITGLHEGSLHSLADAFLVVHRGERRMRKGKNFPSQKDEEEFNSCQSVLADLASTVMTNTKLLDTRAGIVGHEFNGQDTRIGELVLGFYECLLGSTSIPIAGYGQAKQRVEVLSQQADFQLSPFMQEISQFNLQTLPKDALL